MTDFNIPERAAVTDPVFPYLVAEPDSDATSFVTISHEDPFGGDGEPTLFYLAGANLNTRDRRDFPETVLEIVHSFACDVESDRSRVAQFTVRSMQMTGSYDNSILFTGWLTEAKFYPDVLNLNPFLDAEDEGYEENSKYPYLPPKTVFSNLTFPLPVQIRLSYNYSEAVLPLLQKQIVAHADARVKRDAEKEKQRLELEARREKSRKDHEAWLQTEEGKEYAVEDILRGFVRNSAPHGVLPEGTEDDLRALALKNFASFSEEDVQRLKNAKATRSVAWVREGTARAVYLEAFDAALDKL